MLNEDQKSCIKLRKMIESIDVWEILKIQNKNYLVIIITNINISHQSKNNVFDDDDNDNNIKRPVTHFVRHFVRHFVGMNFNLELSEGDTQCINKTISTNVLKTSRRQLT